MKKKILFISFFILFSLFSYSQYSELKQIYNYKDYKFQQGDRYNPVFAGIFSYLLPGAGHFYVRENKHGFAFLSGYVATSSLMVSGMLVSVTQTDRTFVINNQELRLSETALFAGVLSLASIYTWSIIDAIRVSKVKNIAIRAKEQESSLIFVKPKLFLTQNQEKKNLQIGINIRF